VPQNTFRHLAGLFAASFLIAAVPAHAAYKCVSNGRTTFQQFPCADGATQTVVRPSEEPVEPAAAKPMDLPSPSSDQEKLDALQSERLRRESSHALRDKLAEFSRSQAVCERDYGVVFSKGPGAAASITGAVYPQNVADASANQAAVHCISRVNELQQQISVLRQQCEMRKCE